MVLFGLPSTVSAEPIQPDRPGFSTGTYTVEPGLAHLELGFQSDYGNKANEPDILTAPLLNLRVGLTPSTELNILLNGWSRESTGNETNTTTSDVLVGAKYRQVWPVY